LITQKGKKDQQLVQIFWNATKKSFNMKRLIGQRDCIWAPAWIDKKLKILLSNFS